MVQVHDISFINDVEIRTKKAKYNYCNIDYNNNKKHLKMGDILDHSKQYSARARRVKKQPCYNQPLARIKILVNNSYFITCKYNHLENTISKLRKNNDIFKIIVD